MSDEWKATTSQDKDEIVDSKAEAKSWKLLEKTLLASVQEQRRSRRWGIFFKSLTKSYSKSREGVDLVFEGWFFVLTVKLSSVGVVEGSPED